MTTVLDSVDIASDVFKSLVWDVWIKNVSFTILSFFGLSLGGPIGIAVVKILSYYADKLYPIIVKVVKVGEIKLANVIHQAAYENAYLKLRVIAIEKGINSDEFKQQRKIEHEKQAALVIFNIQYK